MREKCADHDFLCRNADIQYTVMNDHGKITTDYLKIREFLH